MAQRVGYFENNVIYKEGPFVMTNAGGWRIEVEQKGHQCPVMPSMTIVRPASWPLQRHRPEDRPQPLPHLHAGPSHGGVNPTQTTH